jgi:hypothetical protein
MSDLGILKWLIRIKMVGSLTGNWQPATGNYKET